MTRTALQRVDAAYAVSVSELKKSPSAVLDSAQGASVAVLNHNRVMAYLVPTEVYEDLMERLDDLDLVELAKSRAGETPIPVELDEL